MSLKLVMGINLCLCGIYVGYKIYRRIRERKIIKKLSKIPANEWTTTLEGIKLSTDIAAGDPI